MAVQRVGQGQKGEGGIEAVALAPVGAVEDHRGEKQQDGKGGGIGVFSTEHPPCQPPAGKGQQQVKDHGQGLDKVEVGDGQIRKGSQKIEVRDVVVP